MTVTSFWQAQVDAFVGGRQNGWYFSLAGMHKYINIRILIVIIFSLWMVDVVAPGGRQYACDQFNDTVDDYEKFSKSEITVDWLVSVTLTARGQKLQVRTNRNENETARGPLEWRCTAVKISQPIKIRRQSITRSYSKLTKHKDIDQQWVDCMQPHDVEFGRLSHRPRPIDIHVCYGGGRFDKN